MTCKVKKFLDLGPDEYDFFLGGGGIISFLLLLFWGHESLFHCFLSCTFCFLAFVFLVVFVGGGSKGIIDILLACLCVCALFHCFVLLGYTLG